MAILIIFNHCFRVENRAIASEIEYILSYRFMEYQEHIISL